MDPLEPDAVLKARALQVGRASYVAKLKQDHGDELAILKRNHANEVTELEAKHKVALADAETQLAQSSPAVLHQEQAAMDFCIGRVREDFAGQIARLEAENQRLREVSHRHKVRPNVRGTPSQKQAPLRVTKGLIKLTNATLLLKPVDPVSLNVPHYPQVAQKCCNPLRS
ncbi:hypothetical protein B0A55_11921 [Friedmanniomyces simplex]|uniref:Uncharacterized protein n=1 Tax=Friedmanniomyces simplex TaxID=329884 RepID=A0A4U0VM93_9PEZI|nr:hypothetical protein B0A55_11921 [Friedmanniomyces simplex]